MFALQIRGEAGNLILGDDQPVLAAFASGPLICTGPVQTLPADPNRGLSAVSVRYTFCTVFYPTPMNTPTPPLVFAVPGANAFGSIGGFGHISGPGGWIGFRVVFVRSPDYPNTSPPVAGTDTGWTYKACYFGIGPSQEQYGMRVWDGGSKLMFDSSWEIAAFQGVLTQWSYHKRLWGSGDLPSLRYWGNPTANLYKDVDITGEAHKHAWGHEDGRMGFAISALSSNYCFADVGYDAPQAILTTPTIGFYEGQRNFIYASLMFGILQHPSTQVSAMSNYALPVARFNLE